MGWTSGTSASLPQLGFSKDQRKIAQVLYIRIIIMNKKLKTKYSSLSKCGILESSDFGFVKIT